MKNLIPPSFRLLRFSSALLALSCSALPMAQAAFILSDDFESNSLSGGTGWSTNWTHSGGGGTFLSNEIDGSFSAGLFTGGGGTSVLSRSFDPIDSGAFTASWSVKGLASMNSIGVNLRGLKSNDAANIITLKFDNSDGGIRMNDGGSDFTASSAVTYSNGAIYDFSVSMVVGSGAYDWSVTRRDSTEAASANGFTFSGDATLTNFSAIEFFWAAPGGGGNDAFIDNVSVIPEPSSYAILFGLGALGLAVLRRTRLSR